MRLRVSLQWLVISAALAGCAVPGLTVPGREASIGWPSYGVLVRGRPMPNAGQGFMRARPTDDTRFGTSRLVSALTRAADVVARRFPGGAPLRIGDLSAPKGGAHPRHHSHRTGRDVDVIFFAVDPRGRSLDGRGWVRFDEYGLALPNAEHEVARAEVLFDDARNWQFVRTLLLDGEAGVQWIFCSSGVKSRLLQYAIAHEPSSEVLLRAAYVLHQPTEGRPHDDHFHVRVSCSAEERSLGCKDFGPVWPWLRNDLEKPVQPLGNVLDDDTLVLLLTSPVDAEPAAKLSSRVSSVRE